MPRHAPSCGAPTGRGPAGRPARLLPIVLMAAALGGCGSDHPGTPRKPDADGLRETINVRYVYNLAWNPDVKAQVALFKGTRLDVHDVDARAMLFQRGMLPDCDYSCSFTPSSVAYSPDGRSVAAGPLDDIVLLDARTGAPRDTLATGYGLTSMPSVGFSPDSRKLYVTNQSGRLSVWQLRPKRLIYQGDAGTDRGAEALAVSPDGVSLALSGFSHKVWLWSTREQATYATLDMDSTFTTDMAWSPDGRYLAVTGSYRTLVVWDVPARRVAWLKSGLEFGSAAAVDISPDGRLLATNLTRTDLALLDAGTGQVLSQWRTQADSEIFDLAFSRDGRDLAASSHAGVKIWDVATRLEIGVGSDAAPR